MSSLNLLNPKAEYIKKQQAMAVLNPKAEYIKKQQAMAVQITAASGMQEVLKTNLGALY